MSSKWNFKNNAAKAENYAPLDTNPDHYKSKLRKYIQPLSNNDDSKPTEGVSIRYIDGSTFKTKEFTVDDIYDALHVDKVRWLKRKNGGEINLGYVMHYEPFTFYPDDRWRD